MSYNALRQGRHSEPGRDYLVTTVVNLREPVFGNLYAARCLVAELHRLEEDAVVRWLAWVIMPDHFHGLMTILQSHRLGCAMNLLKGRSGRSVNRLLQRRSRLWQPGFHDHALRREEDRAAVAGYVLANPLRSGLVADIGDYPHWDSVIV
jgi:REP element-mobilizing transposase RayT